MNKQFLSILQIVLLIFEYENTQILFYIILKHMFYDIFEVFNVYYIKTWNILSYRKNWYWTKIIRSILIYYDYNKWYRENWSVALNYTNRIPNNKKNLFGLGTLYINSWNLGFVRLLRVSWLCFQIYCFIRFFLSAHFYRFADFLGEEWVTPRTPLKFRF